MPPILAKWRYRRMCVGVSLEGRRRPSTTAPSRSTTTMCEGSNCSYDTPLGLMTASPRLRSRPLVLPQVNTTRPQALELAICLADFLLQGFEHQRASWFALRGMGTCDST